MQYKQQSHNYNVLLNEFNQYKINMIVFSFLIDSKCISLNCYYLNFNHLLILYKKVSRKSVTCKCMRLVSNSIPIISF